MGGKDILKKDAFFYMNAIKSKPSMTNLKKKSNNINCNISFCDKRIKFFKDDSLNMDDP